MILNLHQKAVLPNLDKYDWLLLFFVVIACSTYMLTTSILLITLLQLLLIAKAFYSRKCHTKSLKEIITALFMGAEVALFLISIVYLTSSIAFRSKTFFLKRNAALLVLTIYSFCVFILSSIHEFLPLNYALWLMIFLGGFTIYLYAQENHQQETSFNNLKFFLFALIAIQFLFLLIQGALVGSYSPGDWALGTFMDAHKLGFVLMFFAIYLSFDFKESPSIQFALLIPVSLIFLYVCDAKAVLLSGILSAALLIILSATNFSIGRRLINRTAAIYSLIILIIFTFIIASFNSYEKVWEDFLDIYAYGTFTSSKYQMYGKVWGQMLHDSPFNWAVGVGPGEMASKASNMLSGDVLWKREGGLASLLPSFSSSWTKTYMLGLFDHDVAAMIPHVSAVLAYPFAGFISIKAELGLIGLILYSYVFYRVLTNSLTNKNTVLDKTLIFMGVTLYISLLFDNYHEQIPIIGLYMLILGLNEKKPLQREIV